MHILIGTHELESFFWYNAPGKKKKKKEQHTETCLQYLKQFDAEHSIFHTFFLILH